MEGPEGKKKKTLAALHSPPPAEINRWNGKVQHLRPSNHPPSSSNPNHHSSKNIQKTNIYNLHYLQKTKSRVGFVTIMKQIVYFLTRAQKKKKNPYYHWKSSKVFTRTMKCFVFPSLFHQTSSLDIIDSEYLIYQNTGINNGRVPDATNDSNIFFFLNLNLMFLHRLDSKIQDKNSGLDAVFRFSTFWTERRSWFKFS
jgi:hypothetical protein